MPADKVIITSRFADSLVQQLAPHATIIMGSDPAKGMPRAEILAQAGDVVGIINQNELRIDQELLDHAPRLKVVANAAAGFDNMVIAAMRARGVIGTNCPDSFSADTATHAIGLLLALTRRILEADGYVRSGRWAKEGWMPGGRWDGMSLEGKRLGLIGYGHIGRQVERRAAGFGMEVRHHTRSRAGAAGWLALPELLQQSDVVSLHCPLTAETRHLINAKTLAMMRKGTLLVNVSRGPVVDTKALVAALQSGHLAGAGLDVFEFEPEVPAELLTMPNVVLSPHMAGCTVESRQSAQQLCVDNVVAVLAGQAPKTPAFSF